MREGNIYIIAVPFIKMQQSQFSELLQKEGNFLVIAPFFNRLGF